MPRENLLVRIILRLLFFIALLFIAILALPKVFSFFSPFIFAFILAAALNPLVNFMTKKFRFSRRIMSFVMVLLVFSIVATLIAWVTQTFINEVRELTSNTQSITAYFTSALEPVLKWVEPILELLPDGGETAGGQTMTDSLLASVSEWLVALFNNIASYTFENFGSMTAKVSNVVISIVVFILSAYFLTVDYPKISDYFKRFNKTYGYKRLVTIKNTTVLAFAGYLKAQFLIAFFGFAIMFLALTIYGQDYALLISIILAIVDFLPFLGMGAVLLPWGVISYLGGYAFKAVFLIILSVSFFFIRRFAEPKIVSVQTGLTPFIALFSTFIGMKLVGVSGIILGPVMAVVVISVVKSGIFENTKNDIKTLVSLVTGMLKVKK